MTCGDVFFTKTQDRFMFYSSVVFMNVIFVPPEPLWYPWKRLSPRGESSYDKYDFHRAPNQVLAAKHRWSFFSEKLEDIQKGRETMLKRLILHFIRCSKKSWDTMV